MGRNFFEEEKTTYENKLKKEFVRRAGQVRGSVKPVIISCLITDKS